MALAGLLYFHQGNEDLSQGYAAEHLGGKDGLEAMFAELQRRDVAENMRIDDKIDVLVVEDDLPDIVNIIHAAIKCEIKLTLGICYSPDILKRLFQNLSYPPKTITLDFELIKNPKVEVSKRLARTEDIVKEIGTLPAWEGTIILGITNWAHQELSNNLQKMIRDRRDGVYQKSDSLWRVLHEVIHDLVMRSDNQVRQQSIDHSKYSFPDVIGHSKAMQEVFGLVDQVANSNTTVLITGETGTGKELVARAIHKNSPRHGGPLVQVNCAAIPDTLIESELFGHEKGAFTGALQQRRGRFEEANGGTIFLDEVGELTAAAQVKLLRVLQEKRFQPLGSSRVINVNVRIIAATNRNLEQDILFDRFRADLFYRLNVFPIYLPALRERGSDVILLADHFLLKYSKETGKNVKRISNAVIEVFLSHKWPGNVRELENCIERAVLLTKTGMIDCAHLPPSLQEKDLDCNDHSNPTAQERTLIVKALRETEGNLTKAAKMLGVKNRRTLQLKIIKMNIDKNLYNEEDIQILAETERWNFNMFLTRRIVNENKNEGKILKRLFEVEEALPDEAFADIYGDIKSSDVSKQKRAKANLSNAICNLRKKMEKCSCCLTVSDSPYKLMPVE